MVALLLSALGKLLGASPRPPPSLPTHVVAMPLSTWAYLLASYPSRWPSHQGVQVVLCACPNPSLPLWGCLGVLQTSSLEMVVVWKRSQGSSPSLPSSDWTSELVPSSAHSLLKAEHCFPVDLPTCICLIYPCWGLQGFGNCITVKDSLLWYHPIHKRGTYIPLALPTQILCGMNILSLS